MLGCEYSLYFEPDFSCRRFLLEVVYVSSLQGEERGEDWAALPSIRGTRLPPVRHRTGNYKCLISTASFSTGK